METVRKLAEQAYLKSHSKEETMEFLNPQYLVETDWLAVCQSLSPELPAWRDYSGTMWRV